MAKEYIEKDQMHDILAGQFCACSDEVEETINAIWAEVRALPAADVRENVKGEWIRKRSNYAVCPICGYERKMELSLQRGWIIPKFCEDCGANLKTEGDHHA